MILYFSNQKAKANKSKEANPAIVKSIDINGYHGKGFISQVSPKIHSMLNILLPMAFPTAISECFFSAAKIETASSGKEVPIAKTVAPITSEGIFRRYAKLVAPCTIISPPRASQIAHHKIITRLIRGE